MLELLKMDYKISVNTFKGINKKLKKKNHIANTYVANIYQILLQALYSD